MGAILIRYRFGLALVLVTPLLAASAEPALTPKGFGPLHIGMTRRQIEHVIGQKLEGAGQDEPCFEGGFAALPGLVFMFEDNRLTVLSDYSDASIPTADGVRIGTKEDALRRIFGRRALFHPRPYEGDMPGAHEVIVRLGGKREYVFETENGAVASIRIGDAPSAEYWEGCA